MMPRAASPARASSRAAGLSAACRAVLVTCAVDVDRMAVPTLPETEKHSCPRWSSDGLDGPDEEDGAGEPGRAPRALADDQRGRPRPRPDGRHGEPGRAGAPRCDLDPGREDQLRDRK